MTPDQDGEAGFTLVEMIMAIAVSSIVFVAIVVTVLAGVRNADAGGTRVADSTDAQLAQTYFTTDVQSAENIGQSGSTCPAVAGFAGTTLLTLQWTDRATATQTDYVSQWLYHQNGAAYELDRVTCTGAATFAGTTATSSIVLARALTGAPTLSCTYSTGAANASCADSAANPFTTISLTATSASKGREAIDDDSLTWILKAARRVS